MGRELELVADAMDGGWTGAGGPYRYRRLFDPAKNVTVSMRGKEEAHDYRYFPDSDLVPLIVDDTWIQEMANELPELEDAKQKRFVKNTNYQNMIHRF